MNKHGRRSIVAALATAAFGVAIGMFVPLTNSATNTTGLFVTNLVGSSGFYGTNISVGTNLPPDGTTVSSNDRKYQLAMGLNVKSIRAGYALAKAGMAPKDFEEMLKVYEKGEVWELEAWLKNWVENYK